MDATHDQPSPRPEDITNYIFPEYTRIRLAAAIPTLHYLAFAPQIGDWDDANFDAYTDLYQYWRIVRPPGQHPRLEPISEAEGTAVRGRIVSMDRESLLNFNINTFLA